MKATFSARAYDKDYSVPGNTGKLRWPQVFRVTFGRHGLDRQSISGARDYSSRAPEMWFVVDDGVYEVHEYPPKGETTRAVRVRFGEITELAVEDMVRCIANTY